MKSKNNNMMKMKIIKDNYNIKILKEKIVRLIQIIMINNLRSNCSNKIIL